MRIKAAYIPIAILALAGLVILINSLYTVQETEQTILTQFGEPVGEPVRKAGLHFKKPFIQKIHSLDKRILEWDGESNQIPTKDKLFIFVNTYARWRISDPLQFYKRLRDEVSAQSRLDDIIDGETRNAVASHDLVEIIRTENRTPEIDATLASAGSSVGRLQTISVGQGKIAKEIAENAARRVSDLGIELLDMRFKRINYSQDVQNKIYERMISERKQIAAKFRSEGEGEAARINGEREYQLKKIESEAYKKIQEIKGNADAKATDIYAQAYNKSPEATAFFSFLKTMETYEETLDKSTKLILSTDGEFFKFLKGSRD